MPRIQKVKIGDKEYDAIEEHFEIGREEWNEYKLLDGGVIRLKTSVQRIYRIVDSEGRQLYNEAGDPHVIVRHKTDVVPSI